MATFITTEAGELLLTENDYFLIIDEVIFAAIRKTFTVMPRITEFTVNPRTTEFTVMPRITEFKTK